MYMPIKTYFRQWSYMLQAVRNALQNRTLITSDCLSVRASSTERGKVWPWHQFCAREGVALRVTRIPARAQAAFRTWLMWPTLGLQGLCLHTGALWAWRAVDCQLTSTDTVLSQTKHYAIASMVLPSLVMSCILSTIKLTRISLHLCVAT